MRRLRGLTLLAAALLCGQALAAGKYREPSDTAIDPTVVRIDEAAHLGQMLDARTPLLDEAGRPFALGELLGKPVIVVFSYYGCDGSCPTINQNLADALKGVGRFRLGVDYRVLTVSFDRADGTAEAAGFAARTLAAAAPHGDAGDGWRVAVLGDPDADAPARLARSVGFRFFWSRIDRTFLHPNVLVFLTPEGRVARYLYGAAMQPRNVELALIDADWGRISTSASTVFDMLAGACFSFNYSEGRYQPNYALFAGLGSLALGLGLVSAGLLAYKRQPTLARRTPDAS